MTCATKPLTNADLTRIARQLEGRFPTLQSDRPLYLVNGDEAGTFRRIASLRAEEPEATILVLSETNDSLHMRRLLHSGSDGVFDPRYADERDALMRAAAVHVARAPGSRGGIVSACRALRSLLVEWSRHMSVVERAQAAA